MPRNKARRPHKATCAQCGVVISLADTELRAAQAGLLAHVCRSDRPWPFCNVMPHELGKGVFGRILLDGARAAHV